MCGRYYLRANERMFRKRFGVTAVHSEFAGSQDVRPTNNVPVILNIHPDEIVDARWGFIPVWAKDMKTGLTMINARAEGLSDSKVYRPSLKSKRCLIAADGFYEWKKNLDGSKTPMRFALEGDELFAFAGLWSTWKPRDGEPVISCTIITTTPNQLVEGVHDRMPAILARENEELWLDTARH